MSILTKKGGIKGAQKLYGRFKVAGYIFTSTEFFNKPIMIYIAIDNGKAKMYTTQF